VRSAIEFVLNGEIRRVAPAEPTMTVLRYLREVERLVGTKEGCAEGDCGACTAVVATLENGSLRYQAINTCICFLGMLDGKALITVEYLATREGLHPAQEGFIHNHATQCGFCTPGFVMSLFAACHDDWAGNRQSIDTILAGNLCRCTGYTPIINAAAQVLQDKNRRRPFAARAQGIADLLGKIAKGDGLTLSGNGSSYIAPPTKAALAKVLLRYPRATLLAGGTDVGLFVTKQQRTIETLVDLGKIRELRRISRSRQGLRLGAAVSYADACVDLVKLHPELATLINRLGSVQVRNLGTIGGNIANGSPIGDMPPALIALDARLRLQRGSEYREIALEDYFVEYGRQNRRRSEFVESILIPATRPGSFFRVYKISKRFDQDISSVCGAFHFAFDKKSRKIASARICFGGMAGTPMRARACERFLTGKSWEQEVIAEAGDILQTEFDPISDWRASAGYRQRVAGNLLRRCFVESKARQPLQLADREAAIHA